MKSSVLRRGVLAVLVAAAPLGGAVAQQTDQRGFGQEQQPQSQQQQQQPPGQQHPQPRPNPPPPAQHAAPPPPQGQHPAQNGVPPNAGPQHSDQQTRGAQFPQRSGAPSGSTVQAAPQRPVGGQTPRGNPAPDRGRGGTPNFAEHHGGAAPEQFDRGRFYGHDFAHFTPHEQALWHDGRWHHESHGGRYGWWYDVDDVWYYYPEPLYPYPTFVPEIVYLPEVEEAPPPEIVSPPAQTYYYYYCDDAQAYYPYVASCDMPWRQVPATPPQ